MARHKKESPGKKQLPQQISWFSHFSVDLFAKILKRSIFHPFICWLLPLCLRARTVKWESPPMVGAFAWAVFISIVWLAGLVNDWIAHGLPREVDLSEEVIVITGGAGGMGLLLAEVYGMRGASVAVLDVAEMEDADERGVTFYKCDVGDSKQLARVAAQIEEDLGTPTVLINNAAVVAGRSLLNISIEELDKSLRTNIVAPFYCIKTFLPGIVRGGRGGTIVNISSVIGHLGAAQLADYAASKAGVSALHKSLTAELRETHPEIRTVLVTLGQLSTPLFYGVETPSSFMAPVVEPVDVVKEMVDAIDRGRGATIALPLYARWVDWYNVLPAGLQIIARKIAGVDRGMRTFKGRGAISDSEISIK
ncbi:unnamed protein product [Clonostachys rosea]|uniref:Ketoreductase domain-containing protein n=1 Tax=Bionectria ochroleuca TaxID=29856 RepID=A0ABY6UWG8_BIOOC|nr:unnamed protein product [Clonostachys rosea]